MISIFFRSTSTLVFNHTTIALLASKPQLGLLPFIQLLQTTRPLSSLNPETGKKESFTISYLVNNCGLSPDAAKSASKYVLFANPEKPDAVLGLLRDFGITHFSLAVKKRPQLLLADVNTILPKLRFFRSMGFSVDDLRRLVCQNPAVLFLSLERSLIPCYDILKKRLLLSDQKAVVAMRRLTVRKQLKVNTLSVNLSVLKAIGMPDSIISSLVTWCPFVLCRSVDKFNEVAKELVEIGFDPSQYVFASALIAKLQLSTRTWKYKIDALKKWGLSEDEIFSIFRKCPVSVILSAELIRSKMDFIVNKMGWPLAAVVKDPRFLTYSLDTRIVPRCSVIRLLFLKGLIKGKMGLHSVIKTTNGSFLDKYVIKHQEQVPELLDILQGKLNLEDLGFGFDKNSVASTV